jgi:hypothetical protein
VTRSIAAIGDDDRGLARPTAHPPSLLGAAEATTSQAPRSLQMQMAGKTQSWTSRQVVRHAPVSQVKGAHAIDSPAGSPTVFASMQ